jgi:hypothetical protein
VFHIAELGKDEPHLREHDGNREASEHEARHRGASRRFMHQSAGNGHNRNHRGRVEQKPPLGSADVAESRGADEQEHAEHPEMQHVDRPQLRTAQHGKVCQRSGIREGTARFSPVAPLPCDASGMMSVGNRRRGRHFPTSDAPRAPAETARTRHGISDEAHRLLGSRSLVGIDGGPGRDSSLRQQLRRRQLARPGVDSPPPSPPVASRCRRPPRPRRKAGRT